MTSEPTYFPWLLGIAVVLVLLWLTWRRPNRKRLPWRILASSLTGISLILLLYPPTYKRQVDPGTAILLTAGYHPDTLTAILQRFEAAPSIYSYQSEASDAAPVSNLYTLLQEQPQLQTIHLLGNGLEAQELKALGPVKVVPHLAARPMGIADLQLPAATQLGKAVNVAGQFNAASEQTILYLQAAGKVQDSVQISEAGLSPFQLGYTPKQEGRSVYRILAKTQDRTDTLGQIPVQVLPAEKLSILLFSAAPLFEFKFLKNHLGELQHKVALRSTVSKGITQSEWINMPQTNLGRLSSDLLKQFDLVITEPQALQDLSQLERSALQKAVTENGLGVLTIRGEQPPHRSTDFFTGFTARRVSQQENRNTSALWANNNQAAARAVPYTLVTEDAITGLIQDKDNGLLAAAKKQGWGTVAVSMIPQSFSWQLEGKEKIYASYWAYLLSEIAKEKVQSKFWQLTSPKAPKQNSPATLTYTDYTLGDGQALPETLVRSETDTAGVRLALQQHPHLPEQFTATFRPKQAGWHVVQTPSAPEFYFFVQDSADWTHEAVSIKRQATKAFAAQQNATTSIDGRIATTREQVPVFWFFLLFVLSSGFLWLEEKL